MTEAKHTALPWKACKEGDCRCGFIWDATGEVHVASVHDQSALGADWYGSDVACSPEQRQANAELIITAVNAHSDLVAVYEAGLALESIVKEALYRSKDDQFGTCGFSYGLCDEIKARLADFQAAALKLAGGE